jgi:hypothetical protein
VVVLAVCLLGAGPAVADRSCIGKLSGSMIDTLPHPAVINVHITDASPANVALGERFKAGMRAGGAMLSDTGPVTMELATSITGLPAGTSGTGAVSPEFGQVGNLQGSPEPPVLTMSISLMDTTQAQIDWVGYVNCRISTSDMGAVAQDLGYAIGRSIGQDFSPRPL